MKKKLVKPNVKKSIYRAYHEVEQCVCQQCNCQQCNCQGF